MKHRLSLLILAVFTAASTGCALSESGQQAVFQMKHLIRPKPYDEPVQQEDVEDDWSFVGAEARAGQPRERDPDRWWQDMVMSPEARQIERNLGID